MSRNKKVLVSENFDRYLLPVGCAILCSQSVVILIRKSIQLAELSAAPLSMIARAQLFRSLSSSSSSSTPESQRYTYLGTYRVLQTIQMKLILLCVWGEQAVLVSAKTALKFKYEIVIG